MKHGKNSQLLPVVVIVIVVVISVALIVTLVRTFILGGGSSSTQQTQRQKDSDEAALLNTAIDRGVRMTIRGEITADEKFRSYRITVTPTTRIMTTYAGYLDQTIDHVTLENNSRSYEEFVYALNRANMMKGDALIGEKDDTRGLCASGKILEFETLQNDRTVKRLWTTTCKKDGGSLQANASQLSDMFLAQIPQGKELLKKINK